jgi:UDP-N-acetylmuramate dehydrogenase
VIVQINQSLKQLNTFGIDQKAERLIWAQSTDEVLDYIKHYGAPYLVLGGGSNMLLTKDLEGDVLKIDIRGRQVVFEDEDVVHVKLGAGENWHEAVLWTLSQGWAGLENLSLIPGNCGTAPVQNIGAYGVELKDVFVSCEGVNLKDKTHFNLPLDEVQFGYRNSIFKGAWKQNAIITWVTLKLTKRNHNLKVDYGAIQNELANVGVTEPTPKQISNAIIAIRESKLPDPAKLGNSGSFFKNPIVDVELAQKLVSKYPDLPCYEAVDGKKISAGWLIEKAGWKGFRDGDAGVHKKQALVLVNYGEATGTQILDLSKKIIADIHRQFEVLLEAEVNLL